jgi:2-(1,2-epoxy-1,2-dihydrophenyl)acetyl-CoA isomerase
MPVDISNEGAVRIITLNRPAKLNALTLAMATDICNAVESAAADPSVRCLLLTGGGRAFSSGGDVNEMGEHLPRAGDLFYQLTDQLHDTVSAMLTMRKPVVTAINGIVAGGAIGMALAGDVRIAAESAQLLSAHFKRGFVPAGGATYLLPRLIGLSRTQALFFGERTLTGAEMHEWGLVHHLVPDRKLAEFAMAEAQRLAAGPTQAMGETKRLLAAADNLTAEEQLELESERNRDSGNAGDAVEGITAFLEKREPEFGRTEN